MLFWSEQNILFDPKSFFEGVYIFLVLLGEMKKKKFGFALN